MTDCPICERRAAQEQKSASDCKQEVKQLEAKHARLTIILAIFSTLVGKELLDEALALADSIPFLSAAPPPVEAIAVNTQPEENSYPYSGKGANRNFVVSHGSSSITSIPVFLANVPPLITSLYAPNYVTDQDFVEELMVPESVYPLLFLASTKYIKGRKR
mgnify:CR=1 FL=1